VAGAGLEPATPRFSVASPLANDPAHLQVGQIPCLWHRQSARFAVHSYLGEDDLVVGGASLNEAAPEVLTPTEAAAFLRVEGEVLLRAAEGGEIPARR